MTIHRCVHQSARHERSGRVNTAKIHVFLTRVFLDRCQKAHICNIIEIIVWKWGWDGAEVGTGWGRVWGRGWGWVYMSDTCRYNIWGIPVSCVTQASTPELTVCARGSHIEVVSHLACAQGHASPRGGIMKESNQDRGIGRSSCRTNHGPGIMAEKS